MLKEFYQCQQTVQQMIETHNHTNLDKATLEEVLEVLKHFTAKATETIP